MPTLVTTAAFDAMSGSYFPIGCRAALVGEGEPRVRLDSAATDPGGETASSAAVFWGGSASPLGFASLLASVPVQDGATVRKPRLPEEDSGVLEVRAATR